MEGVVLLSLGAYVKKQTQSLGFFLFFLKVSLMTNVWISASNKDLKLALADTLRLWENGGLYCSFDLQQKAVMGLKCHDHATNEHGLTQTCWMIKPLCVGCVCVCVRVSSCTSKTCP